MNSEPPSAPFRIALQRAEPYRLLGYLTLFAVLLLLPQPPVASWLLVFWSIVLWRVARSDAACAALCQRYRWRQRSTRPLAHSGLVFVHSLEACLVVVLVLCAPVSLVAAGAFVACLLLAILAQGGLRLLLAVLPFAFLVLPVALWLATDSRPPADFFQRWAPWLLLAVYGAAFSSLGYQRVRRLKHYRRADADSLRVLSARSARLARYLPSTLVDQVVAAPDGPAQRERVWLVVAFVDLCGFTDLAERLDDEVLSPVLDDYLQLIYGLAAAHDGIVGKVIGDGVLVFWQCAGAGLAVEPRVQAARQAGRFARLVNSELESLTSRWHQRGELLRLQARTAITSGYCTLGDWGAADEGGAVVPRESQSLANRCPLEYTLIGRAVNLAARLQEHAAPGGLVLDAGVAQLLAGSIPLAGPRRLEIKNYGELDVFLSPEPAPEERQRNLTLVH